MQPDLTKVEDDIKFNVTAFPGISMGLGQDDPGVVNAERLAAQYPDHMILIQAGTFIHGYDATAHILSAMKGYKLQLVGTSAAPHIRVGFPVTNFKRRMHEISNEFDTPYVAAVGCKKMGYTVFVSSEAAGDKSLLRSVPEGIVDQVISDLQQRGELNKVGAKQLLANPDRSGFKLKSHAQDLDTQITMDLIKMSRDVRATFGENLRECMARIMGGVFAYGNATNKIMVLHDISANLDQFKHYLEQAKKISQIKIALKHRAGLAVELGRLVGGLIRAGKAAV